MREVCFGIDVGGTTVKMGLVARDGQLLEKQEFVSPHDVEEMFDNIAVHMSEVMSHFPDCECIGAGIGVPGPVVNERLVRGCTNLGWGDVDVAAELGRTGLPVKAANDANLAALGEMWQGAGRGCKDLVLLTVGTGIGGGIISNGHMVAGSMGGGGEVGHIPTGYHTDWQCSCGKYGCLEVTASASGIIRAARQFSPFKEAKRVTAKDVFDAARDGDENARRVVTEAGHALGHCTAILGCVLNPELILIGGGVSAAGRPLMDPVEETFRQEVFGPCSNVRFARAMLGNDAGILGGAAMFFCE